jgi:prepilin-type N-terminal cleavage/methylation domain-containing protein
MYLKRNQSGFTIVELLIVVVVIGILAAIVIVAYNGITQSAQKAAVVSAVNQTTKLFDVYALQYGSYPSVSTYTCIAGFDESGDCHYASGNDPGRSSTLETELQKVGTIPSFPSDSHSAYNGLVFRYAATETYQGKPARYTLEWKLQGENQDCGVANSVRLASGAFSPAPNHASWTGTTQCLALLTDPGNL